MSSPPPTKPPRGVKQGKETSGLLMSVIRTLSASETNEQREKERAKLEKEYKKSDARLDELVAVHAQEIMEVMQKFTAVNTVLTGWGQHNDAAVARLNACRGLLRVLGDELRRLWMDLRTHHYALQMLNDIERVVVSERETREAMSCGRVLLAATTLSDALYAHDTTLAHVTALNATRTHLEGKKQELVSMILRKISEAVYMGERDLSRRLSARRRAALLLAELTKSEDVTETYLQDITPELEASLTEEDKTFDTTIVISLEALGVLSQLKEATEKFKCRIQNELLEVIEVVSRRILDEGESDWNESEQDGDNVSSEGASDTGRPLADLVAALHDEFIATGNRNNRLIQLWRATMQKYHLSNASLHTEQHYWSAVQQVLQLLLTEYLQIESVTLAARNNPAAPAPEKLPDYFAKKVQRRKPKLFTFTAPPSDVLVRSPSRHKSTMVCPANPAHLHAALPTLHALCHHIETIFGGECSLRVFITDYVRSGESERLASAARGDIDNAMRVVGAWRERGQPAYTSTKNSSSDRHRVIFTCCSAAWQAIHATTLAARRCGACGGAEAARAVLSALATLGTHCREAHHKLAPSHNSHSRAQRWLSDDDIVRFLQSLPNWRAATDPHNTKHTAQDLSEAYEREAEILGTNLGDGLLTRKEIISDINTLVDLAVLCESMDWLSTNIKSIPSILNAPAPGGGVKLPEKLANDIASAAMIFDEISHKCLLLLHLELRIQCFYYLGQEETTLDADQSDGATQLAHALLSFHEHAAKVLADVRRAYILDGLGEMMSAGVVWRWQGEARAAGASTGASTRLATLRHCLAALQLPHNGLHRAHDYLHILTCTPQEIITTIREKSARFSELEYLNAFKVIGARLNIPQQEMKGYLKQLSMALGHVGVTV